MRLLTEEIEEEAEKLYVKINESVDEEYRIDCHGYYFFKKSDPSYPSVTYVYSDKDGYHMDTVGDRGGIEGANTYEDIEDIYFLICWHLAYAISSRYAVKNSVKGKDSRRVMFPKRLEILQKVNPKYYQKGKEVIEDTLRESPYDDEITKKYEQKKNIY
ncbi:MAG TPA: Imm63 family immunity protein [Spirochaetota bacterium]